jgi:hypothetical protein
VRGYQELEAVWFSVGVVAALVAIWARRRLSVRHQLALVGLGLLCLLLRPYLYIFKYALFVSLLLLDAVIPVIGGILAIVALIVVVIRGWYRGQRIDQ